MNKEYIMKKYNVKTKIGSMLFLLGIGLQICIFAYLIYVIYNTCIKKAFIFSLMSFISDIFNDRALRLGVIIIELLVYVLIGIVDKSYYIRRIKEEEYIDLQGRKLIHYSNRKYKFDSETKTIVMEGNRNKIANYSMKLTEAGNSWIWFHQSDRNLEEPIIKSFNYTHSYEEKRKYKIIIDPIELDKDKIYIRDKDKCIVYNDKAYKGKAKVYEEFKWYSGRKIIKNFLDGFMPSTLGNLLVLFLRTFIAVFS